VTGPSTRTFCIDHLTPVGVYAALRSHAAGRSSFLLETVAANREKSPISIVGYRTLSEELYPAGGDALGLLRPTLAALSGGDELAARFVCGLVGYVAFDAAHAIHRIEPWANEGDLARMMKGATVVLFDHERRTMTLAGRSENALDRCAWEMTHGPALEPMAPPSADARPIFVDGELSDDAFAAIAERARATKSGFTLGRRFIAPERDADVLDIHRALRSLEPGSRHFLLEFAETPIAPALAIAGVAKSSLARQTGRILPGGPSSWRDASDALAETMPGAAMTGGKPSREVLSRIRATERSTRGIFGGAVGYALPGGDFDFADTSVAVLVRQGQLETFSTVAVDDVASGSEAAAASWREARAPLAAIHAAQDLAAARERAAIARRARLDAMARAAEGSSGTGSDPASR